MYFRLKKTICLLVVNRKYFYQGMKAYLVVAFDKWKYIFILSLLTAVIEPPLSSRRKLFTFNTSGLALLEKTIFCYFSPQTFGMARKIRLVKTPKTAEEVEADRARVTERIESYLAKVGDPENNYDCVQRTRMMTRLEEHVISLLKLPVPSKAEVANKEKELCDKYESIIISDLDDVKEASKCIGGFLRRHRLRVRKRARDAGTGVLTGRAQ